MAFTRKPYCSLSDVKLAMDKQTDADDTLISRKITEAQDAIDLYLGYSFQTDGDDTTPATRLYNGNGSPQLLIDRTVSLAKVELLNYYVTVDQTGKYVRTINSTLDITGDVLLDPPNLSPGFILTRLTEVPFPVGRQNVRVSGVFGVNEIPTHIKTAAIRLTTHYVQMRDATYGDQTSVDQFGQITLRKNIPPDVKELLDRDRRRLMRMR